MSAAWISLRGPVSVRRSAGPRLRCYTARSVLVRILSVIVLAWAALVAITITNLLLFAILGID